MGRKLRLNPAKRLAQIRIHVGVALTQHAVATKSDDISDFRQRGLRRRGRRGRRRLGARHQRTGRAGRGRRHRGAPISVVRRQRQLNGQVAVVTGGHRCRSSSSVCCGCCTRTTRVVHRIARAVNGRDPGAVGAQRAEVSGQIEHGVLARQRDHPIHLHPIGRVRRPLVYDVGHAQYIITTQHVETIPGRIGHIAGHTGAVQIGKIKAVQVTGRGTVLLVGNGSLAKKICDMHRVVAEFNTRAVIADKVRHLQHVARIHVGIRATGFNRVVAGAGDPGLIGLAVTQNTALLSTRGVTAIGKEVRAHRSTVERHGSGGAVFGGGRNRLVVSRLAHGDDFDIAGLSPRTIKRRYRKAVTLRGRDRTGGVGRGPGNVAVLIVAEEARVDILGRHHEIEVEGVHPIRGAAQTELDDLRVLAGIDDMNARHPLAAHRVIRHQGQVAQIVGRHFRMRGRNRVTGVAQAGRGYRGGQSERLENLLGHYEYS